MLKRLTRSLNVCKIFCQDHRFSGDFPAPRFRSQLPIRLDPKARSHNDLLFFALQQSSPVTLREMIEFGSDPHPQSQLLIGQFLRHELPVRLAHRVRDLKRLPFGLAETDAIQGVIQLYEQSFWRIRQFGDLRNSEHEKGFCELLADIYQRHNTVQQSVATGLRDVMRRNRDQVLHGEQFDFSKFLDRFYMSRISIRMLISQYVAIHDQQEGYVGIIARKCRPVAVARDAVEDAQQVCRDHYAVAPEVHVVGSNELSLSFVPSHLYYMFFELLKNSMRAVVERHGEPKLCPHPHAHARSRLRPAHKHTAHGTRRRERMHTHKPIRFAHEIATQKTVA
eukprot:TRINITY_DN3363_c0_g1_i4.p1 TRINITY_DN3363_c0_g1~~TRINITY_DN3363_c0_g1_i4.p1  ORF type:complete len:337 (-),score=25.80 TRINITY_DN3363_c0_g1_i4:107-1117(-)